MARMVYFHDPSAPAPNSPYPPRSWPFGSSTSSVSDLCSEPHGGACAAASWMMQRSTGAPAEDPVLELLSPACQARAEIRRRPEDPLTGCVRRRFRSRRPNSGGA